MSFGSPSSTLCRHWNDMEVVLWRVTCHSLLQGRVLAWWPYCSRPECPRGDEGIIDVRFLVGVLLQPKVRIQTHPFCMLQRGQCDRVFKITVVSDITGSEFAVCVPLWLCPWAAHLFWGHSYGYTPLPAATQHSPEGRRESCFCCIS